MPARRQPSGGGAVTGRQGGPHQAPTVTTEREVKLQPPAGFVMPALGDPLAPRTLNSTYYDTPDNALALLGVTLRRRTEDGKGAWQLKVPRDKSRLEVEASGGPSAPPPAIRNLLVALTRNSQISAVLRMRTDRTGFRVADKAGSPVADVVMDSVAVFRKGRKVGAFQEIEVELTGGSPKELKRLERRLLEVGCVPSSGATKLHRALGLAAPAVPEAISQDPGEVLKAALQAQYRKVLLYDIGVRLGEDPEDLHQFRVALRRCREMLKCLKPMLDPQWGGDLEKGIKRIGKAMNAARDLDVMIDYLRGINSKFGSECEKEAGLLMKSLQTRRDACMGSAEKMMSSQPYFSFLDLLRDAGLQPRMLPDHRVSISDLAGAEFHTLASDITRLGGIPDEESVHSLRITGKRVRYAAELVAASGGKRVEAFLERAKAFQDVLGESNDARVLEGEARDFAKRQDTAESWFFCGRLVEHEEARRRASLERFSKTWRQMEKAGKAIWR
ncbi:MAG: CHAD domain-containing protein [Actinomycetota bacterium]